MKTLSCVLLLMASMAFVLVGCSDNSNSLVSQTDQPQKVSGSIVDLAKTGPETHSATGSGHFVYFGQENYNDQWSFSAKVADGKVTGQVQYTDREMGYTFHGEVYQLIVDGNMAKLGWVAKRGPTYPAWEGLQYGFVVVVDNGEGKGVMDQISWGMLADETGAGGASLLDIVAMDPQGYITWLIDMGLDPPLWEYVDGNIQVR
jgi:hypothetical protein